MVWPRIPIRNVLYAIWAQLWVRCSSAATASISACVKIVSSPAISRESKWEVTIRQRIRLRSSWNLVKTFVSLLSAVVVNKCQLLGWDGSAITASTSISATIAISNTLLESKSLSQHGLPLISSITHSRATISRKIHEFIQKYTPKFN